MWNRKRIDRAEAGKFFEQLEPRRLLSTLDWQPEPESFSSRGLPAFADVNGDGLTDVIATDSVFTGHKTGTEFFVRVLLNQGMNQFTTRIMHFGPRRNILVADLDGNGESDIIAYDASGVSYRLGLGNFQFGTLVSAVLPGMSRISAADFDGDGTSELLVRQGDVINVLRATSSGLETRASFTIDPGQSVIGIADFDGDGVLEIATYDRDASGSLLVWKLDGSTYTTSSSWSVPGSPLAPAVADFDGDGDADLAWAGEFFAKKYTVLLAKNNGDGTFQSPIPILRTGDAWNLNGNMAVDVNSDGFMDLVVFRNDASQLWSGRHAFDAHLSDGNGGFASTHSSAIYRESGPNRIVDARQVVWGDITNDGFLDVQLDFLPTPILLHARFEAPQVSDVIVSDPIVPGTPFSISANVMAFEGKSIDRVELFQRDPRSPTRPPVASDLIGTFSLSSQPDLWIGTFMVTDDMVRSFSTSSAPQIRFVVLAHDSTETRSDYIDITPVVWSRIFYPEGWRNDERIAEWITLANPHANIPTPYRVVVRYETGQRDVVIAEGTLDGLARTTITLSEPGSPGAALVRGSVGYAIEVQSRLFIGASITHKDNFGQDIVDDLTTVTEAFSSASSTRWGFADVSIQTNDFLVFYNPFDHTTNIEVTFYGASFDPIIIRQTLAGLRRGGLALRDIPALAATDTDYSVEIVASEPIAVALSRYSFSGGKGFTTSAHAGDFLDVRGWIGDGASRVTLFNPGSVAINVKITLTYDDTTLPPLLIEISVESFTRVVKSIDGPAAGVAVGSLPRRRFYAQIEGDTFNDVGVAIAPDYFSTKWVFGESIFRRNQTQLTLHLVRTDGLGLVTLNFIFGGTSHIRTFDFRSSGTTITHVTIDLDQDPVFENAPDFTGFSLVVSSSPSHSAFLSIWDPIAGTGEQTLGTPATLFSR